MLKKRENIEVKPIIAHQMQLQINSSQPGGLLQTRFMKKALLQVK